MNLRTVFITYLFMLIILDPIPTSTESSIHVSSLNLGLRFDYLIHAILYFPFLFIAKYGVNFSFGKSLVAGAVLAIFLEIAQIFISYRTFNINDLLANLIGLLIGVFFLLPFFSKIIFKIKFIRN